MNTAKFDQFVKRHKIGYVLQKHAGELNQEQLDYCVKRSPSMAIEHAINLLTPTQRDFCLQEEPDTAFENLEKIEKHGYKLSPAEFDSCVRRSPAGALAYVADRLNPKQFDFCLRRMPEEALKHAAKKLSPMQFAFCVYSSPYTALEYVAKRLSPKQLAFCFEEYPDATLEYAADRLSRKQLAFCVEEYPWETLLFAANLISTKQLLDCASRCSVKLNNYLRKDAQNSPKLVRALMAVVSQLPQSTRKAVAMVAAKSI